MYFAKYDVTLQDFLSLFLKVTAAVVMIVNNLLQVGDDQLGESDLVANSTSRIVRSLGRQISNVLADGGNVSEVTSSLVVVAKTFPLSSLANGLGFAAVAGENETDSLAEDQIGLYDSGTEIPVGDVASSVKLPAEIVNQLPQGKQHIIKGICIHDDTKCPHYVILKVTVSAQCQN